MADQRDIDRAHACFAGCECEQSKMGYVEVADRPLSTQAILAEKLDKLEDALHAVSMAWVDAENDNGAGSHPADIGGYPFPVSLDVLIVNFGRFTENAKKWAAEADERHAYHLGKCVGVKPLFHEHFVRVDGDGFPVKDPDCIACEAGVPLSIAAFGAEGEERAVVAERSVGFDIPLNFVTGPVHLTGDDEISAEESFAAIKSADLILSMRKVHEVVDHSRPGNPGTAPCRGLGCPFCASDAVQSIVAFGTEPTVKPRVRIAVDLGFSEDYGLLLQGFTSTRTLFRIPNTAVQCMKELTGVYEIETEGEGKHRRHNVHLIARLLASMRGELHTIIQAKASEFRSGGTYRCPSCGAAREITATQMADAPVPICYECEMSSALVRVER